MSRLIDEFGRDLGEIIEVDGVDSGDPEVGAYTVYVKPATEDVPSQSGSGTTSS